MYCTLVFVCIALGLLAGGLLMFIVDWWQVASVVALLLILAFVSYHAALSSARAYCVILRVMNDSLTSLEPGPRLEPPSVGLLTRVRSRLRL